MRVNYLQIDYLNNMSMLPVLHKHVVVESPFDGWARTKMTTIQLFHGLSENMSGGVPEDVVTVLGVKFE